MKLRPRRTSATTAKCALGIALSAILTTAGTITPATADVKTDEVSALEESPAVSVSHDVDASSVTTSLQQGNTRDTEASIELSGVPTTDSINLDALPSSVVSAVGDPLTSREIDGSVISAFATPGGLQTFIEIPDSGAPMEYEFAMQVPDGARLSAQPDGSVFVLEQDDRPVAYVDVPWALDARGAEVSTHFRIEGRTLIQVIEPDADTTFPVIADPDFWWIVTQSAGCLAEVSALSLAAAKVVQAFARADRIIRAAQTLGRYYDALGGRMDQVIGVLKKWINNRASLTRSQMTAIEGLVREGGKIIFNVIGLGTCYTLVTQN